MKKTFLLFAALYFSLSFAVGWGEAAFAQTNLVLNPSFEDTVMCPDNISQIARCKYWSNPWEFSTPDYFNGCDMSLIYAGVPQNNFGTQNARTGDAYAGIATAAILSSHQKLGYREYIEGKLSSSLIAGKKYDVQFWVSAYDSAQYTSSNIGLFFSKTFINDTCNFCIMPYTPQIKNDTSNHLISRTNWINVTGSFIANGGEQYIIIGNFSDTATTDMAFMNWSGQNNGVSAYYVDDVLVSTKDTASGINELVKNKITVFPNPSLNIFNASIEYEIISSITVTNVLGEELIQQTHSPPTNKVAVDLSNYPSGSYFLIMKTISNNQYETKLFKQ